MNGMVVVDASLAFKWLVRESNSDRALALARFWDSEGTKPVSPYLMPVEVANALHLRVLRKELTLGTATRLMQSLVASGIELRETPQLYARTLEWADRLRQTAACDAHYLALAQSLECDLWTADEKFYRAASPAATNVHWLGEFSYPVQ